MPISMQNAAIARNVPQCLKLEIVSIVSTYVEADFHDLRIMNPQAYPTHADNDYFSTEVLEICNHFTK